MERLLRWANMARPGAMGRSQSSPSSTTPLPQVMAPQPEVIELPSLRTFQVPAPLFADQFTWFEHPLSLLRDRVAIRGE